MIQSYTFTGSGRQIDAAGVSFRYESGFDGSGVTSIALRIDGNAVGTFEPGDQLDIPTTAKRWEIVPTSSGCTGTVRIGLGKVTSAKLSGIVQTVDGGRTRSITGAAFAGYGWMAATASNNPFVQLWNPSTNKRLVVNGMYAGSNGAQVAHLRMGGVVLSGTGLTQATVVAKSGSSSAPVGEVRAAANASMSAFGGSNAMALYIPTGSTKDHKPSEPWIVPPGTGLLFVGSVQGVDMGATFEWFEESI